MSASRRLVMILGLVLLALSLLLLVFAGLPGERVSETQTIPLRDLTLPTALQSPQPTERPTLEAPPRATATLPGPPMGGAIGAPPAPAITESRAVEIEWPLSIRMGDSDIVRISLISAEAGDLTPTAEIGGHATEGTPIEIPNLYDTHNVVAVARLDSVGFEMDRTGDWEQPLLPGQSVRWQWTITPRQPGRQAATALLRLRFVPRAGGEIQEREVWARTLAINVTTVLGLSARAAQVLGLFGSAVGGVMGLPFIDRLLVSAWERLTGKKRGKKKRR